MNQLQQFQYQQMQQQNQLPHQQQKNHMLLPPITSILQNFPTFQLPIYSNTLMNANDQNSNTEEVMPANYNAQTLNMRVMGGHFEREDENKNNNLFLNEKNTITTQEPVQPMEKTPQYTLADDLLILKTINSYYGTAFHGRVPWSFWQTFRKVTGNKRSPSSLYHHWNGAMKRKYGSFLNHGKINECISWIETAMESGKPVQKENTDNEFTGLPLAHNWSFPPAPIDQNDLNNQNINNLRSIQ